MYLRTFCSATWENYHKISKIEGMYMYTKFLDGKIFPKNSIFYIMGGMPYGKYSLFYCHDKSELHNIEEFKEIYKD